MRKKGKIKSWFITNYETYVQISGLFLDIKHRTND